MMTPQALTLLYSNRKEETMKGAVKRWYMDNGFMVNLIVMFAIPVVIHYL